MAHAPYESCEDAPMLALAPRLETERLVLRAHRADDLDAASAMWGDPDVVRYIGGKPFSRQEAWSKVLRYTGHWALLGFGYWALEARDTGAFLGEIGLADFKRELEPSIDGVPELGFALVPAAHGKGLAKEAARAVLAWADSRFPRTVALVDEGHKGSLRVLEALGYRRCARTRYAGADVELHERLADQRGESAGASRS